MTQNVESLTRSLLRIKERIGDVQKESQALIGEDRLLKKRLLDDFGCKTPAQAKQKLDQLNTEEAELGKRVQSHIKFLERVLG